MHHHAYLLISRNSLPDLSHINKVDFVEVIEPKLSIDTVRGLIDQAYMRPFAPEGQRAIVVVCDQILVEAQNALLKVLEEPPGHTNFYFIISDHSRLLPTLRSRFYVLDEAAGRDVAVFDVFLQLSFAERLALIAEKTTAKDVAWQQSILSGAEQLYLEGRMSSKSALEVLFVKKHLQGPGAASKMLLEHLALVIPAVTR